jgi:hypothetical protein
MLEDLSEFVTRVSATKSRPITVVVTLGTHVGRGDVSAREKLTESSWKVGASSIDSNWTTSYSTECLCRESILYWSNLVTDAAHHSLQGDIMMKSSASCGRRDWIVTRLQAVDGPWVVVVSRAATVLGSAGYCPQLLVVMGSWSDRDRA